jgi:hypothetical protein
MIIRICIQPASLRGQFANSVRMNNTKHVLYSPPPTSSWDISPCEPSGLDAGSLPNNVSPSRTRTGWADWETGARGLSNFWTAVEGFVVQKRSGTIAGMYSSLALSRSCADYS